MKIYQVIPVCMCMSSVVSAGEFSLGVSVSADSEIYEDAGSSLSVFPNISYEGEYGLIEGNTAGLYVFGQQYGEWTVGAAAILSYNFVGYESSDADILRGMRDRKNYTGAGLAFNVNMLSFDIDVALEKDVSNRHDGINGVLTLTHTWFINDLVFSPYIGGSYQSANYIDYYYGVSPSEVIVGRTEYVGQSAVSGLVGFELSLPFSKHCIFSHGVQLTRPGSAITESPLVDEDNKVIASTYVALTRFF